MRTNVRNFLVAAADGEISHADVLAFESDSLEKGYFDVDEQQAVATLLDAPDRFLFEEPEDIVRLRLVSQAKTVNQHAWWLHVAGIEFERPPEPETDPSIMPTKVVSLRLDAEERTLSLTLNDGLSDLEFQADQTADRFLIDGTDFGPILSMHLLLLMRSAVPSGWDPLWVSALIFMDDLFRSQSKTEQKMLGDYSNVTTYCPPREGDRPRQDLSGPWNELLDSFPDPRIRSLITMIPYDYHAPTVATLDSDGLFSNHGVSATDGVTNDSGIICLSATTLYDHNEHVVWHEIEHRLTGGALDSYWAEIRHPWMITHFAKLRDEGRLMNQAVTRYAATEFSEWLVETRQAYRRQRAIWTQSGPLGREILKARDPLVFLVFEKCPPGTLQEPCKPGEEGNYYEQARKLLEETGAILPTDS